MAGPGRVAGAGRRHPAASWRLGTVALVHGAVAGAISALLLHAMHLVSGVVCTGSAGPFRIAATLLVGGVLIALLQRRDLRVITLDSMLADQLDPVDVHRRRTARLAALGILAVGFGGAVGPEAGLIAVIGQLSRIISRRLARTREEARAIAEFGSAAVLSGVYGSPPGGAAWTEDGLPREKTLALVAGVAGFAAFLLTYGAISGGPVDLGIPRAALGGGQLLLALLPALAGAAVAALFMGLRPGIGRLLERVPGGRMPQMLLATTAFALLAAAVPDVRFSGQLAMPQLAELAAQSAFWTLAAIALLKVLATALCLNGGWLGGAIFPLLFSGGAAGASLLGLVPGLEPGTAIVAGLTASAVVGLRKPLAAFLVCAVIVGAGAFAVVAVATLVGVAVGRLLPAPEREGADKDVAEDSEPEAEEPDDGENEDDRPARS